MRRSHPRWLRQLADRCTYTAFHATVGGAGMAPVADLEAEIREQAQLHGMSLGEVVKHLAELAPGPA